MTTITRWINGTREEVEVTLAIEVARLGSGKKTHNVRVWRAVEGGRIVDVYAACGSQKWSMGSGRSAIKLVGEGAEVTCTKCNPDAPKTVAPAAPKVEAPKAEAPTLTLAQQKKVYAIKKIADLRERIAMNEGDERLPAYIVERDREELAKIEAKVARMRVKLPGE